MKKQKMNPYKPIRGIVDVILSIGWEQDVEIRVISVGPGIGENVSTLVKLQIARKSFEVNLVGTWEERKQALEGLLREFTSRLKLEYGPVFVNSDEDAVLCR